MMLPRNALLGQRALADGASEERLEALISQHFRFVYRVLCRSGLSAADADDATQQVFMTAARKIDEIRPGCEQAFLYGTAQRLARNHRRGLRRRLEVGLDASDTEPRLTHHEGAALPSPEVQAQLSEARSLLDRLLAELPPELSRVLVLAEIEQLELADIAKLEEIPQGTAASRLRRARARFQALLADVPEPNPFGDAP
jgi:RNA polymerase sigma-70 factor (ECF subfamily)